MKTDEQILLTYMYEKGYTDEDMFDEKTMKKVRHSLEFCIHRFKLGFPKVVIAIAGFAKKIVAVISGVAERAKEMWPVLKEVTLEEPSIPQYKTFLPIDFSQRPRIQHQVFDRKPKHITRKIIH